MYYVDVCHVPGQGGVARLMRGRECIAVFPSWYQPGGRIPSVREARRLCTV